MKQGEGPVGNRVKVFDTTLRDGEQSPGCSMTAPEKLRLAKQLERLGVDIIEAGFPVASPGDFESVQQVAGEIRACQVAALCRSLEQDIDVGAKALKGAAKPRIHVFLATSAIHLRHKLKIDEREALRRATQAVAYARSLCPDVEFSAEDASRSDPAFLEEIMAAVHEAGAQTLNVPDTVGYALPEEFGALIGRLVRAIPTATISTHCHNDLGLAVANSLAAVRNGARQIEGTINGIGERAGNTAIEEFVMALRVRRESLRLETGVVSEEIYRSSQTLSSITGVWPQPNKAVVGRNAFAHEAGIHQHGVLNNPLTYEIMTPASVGARESQLVLGKHSGHHAVASRLKALGMAPTKEEVERVTAEVKALADRKKFVYDEDLLELVAHAPERRVTLVRFQSVAGNRILPTASVEIEVDGRTRSASAVGNGPVDAALKAVKAALGEEVELLELTTRALTAGTEALAEVVVRLRRHGFESTGQAASTDTLEATLRAYLSAIDGARAAQAAA